MNNWTVEERRHQFFIEKMHALIKPQLKDPSRIFGTVEKELIYYRDKKYCQLPGCGTDVAWSDAEFHHVEMHSKGGSTSLENGALVHADCHPKTAKAVADFAGHWHAKFEKQQIEAAAINSGMSAAATSPPRIETAARRAKRGRPKRLPEESLTKIFEKELGMSPEKAHDEALSLLGP